MIKVNENDYAVEIMNMDLFDLFKKSEEEKLKYKKFFKDNSINLYYRFDLHDYELDENMYFYSDLYTSFDELELKHDNKYFEDYNSGVYTFKNSYKKNYIYKDKNGKDYDEITKIYIKCKKNSNSRNIKYYMFIEKWIGLHSTDYISIRIKFSFKDKINLTVKDILTFYEWCENKKDHHEIYNISINEKIIINNKLQLKKINNYCYNELSNEDNDFINYIKKRYITE